MNAKSSWESGFIIIQGVQDSSLQIFFFYLTSYIGPVSLRWFCTMVPILILIDTVKPIMKLIEQRIKVEIF